jgi:hypothetical protein
MKNFSIKSVDVTPPESSKDRKWTSYQLDGIEIGIAMKFRCNGKFNAGKLGRSFDWHHTNLEKIFGDKYKSNYSLFGWKTPGLVYGVGGTLPLAKIKEILLVVANS